MLVSYVAAYDINDFSDEETYFLLQRLVLARVRNGLFRLYGEVDPQLARILRNVKIAARSLGMFTGIDRLGETCLAPALCEIHQDLPPVEAADLTVWLAKGSSGNEFIPELLGRLCLLLRKQNTDSTVVSIVTIGIAIRTLYDQKRTPQLAEGVTYIDEGIVDAEKAIRQTCARCARRPFRTTYTHKTGSEISLLGLLSFAAIREIAVQKITVEQPAAVHINCRSN